MYQIKLTYMSVCAFSKLEEYGSICKISVYQEPLSSPFFFSRRDLEIERPVPGINVVTLQ